MCVQCGAVRGAYFVSGALEFVEASSEHHEVVVCGLHRGSGLLCTTSPHEEQGPHSRRSTSSAAHRQHRTARAILRALLRLSANSTAERLLVERLCDRPSAGVLATRRLSGASGGTVLNCVTSQTKVPTAQCIGCHIPSMVLSLRIPHGVTLCSIEATSATKSARLCTPHDHLSSLTCEGGGY